MSKSVHIVGLYRSDLARVSWQDLVADGSEVWSLNDWYRSYPWMVPHRVYNVHYGHVSKDPHRFPGDWRAWYQKVIDAGGTVHVVEKVDGVSDEGQVFLPKELKAKYQLSSMVCSISLMICAAVHEGYKKISLKGVRLRNEEYKHQIQGIRNALIHAVGAGVEIDNPGGRDWEDRAVPWVESLDVDTGSLKHIVRYFCDLDPDQVPKFGRIQL